MVVSTGRIGRYRENVKIMNVNHNQSTIRLDMTLTSSKTEDFASDAMRNYPS